MRQRRILSQLCWELCRRSRQPSGWNGFVPPLVALLTDAELCANYNDAYDCCPLLNDYGCYQLTRRFVNSGICGYFRKSVLPLNPALEAVFSRQHTKVCKICGKGFIPNGARKYCSDQCAMDGRRAATAARTQKYRRRTAVKCDEIKRAKPARQPALENGSGGGQYNNMVVPVNRG